MNFIRHFIEWMDFVATDERLTPHHVSLYLALFQSWNLSHFRNPVSISRQQIMQVSKIGSVNTYSKCIKELHTWGYLRYEPSYNPLRGSKVHLYRFDNADDKGSDKAGGQLPIKAVRPSTNYINNINSNKQINSLSKQPVSDLIKVKEKDQSHDMHRDQNSIIQSHQDTLNEGSPLKKEKVAPKEKVETGRQNFNIFQGKKAESNVRTEALSYTWIVPKGKKLNPSQENETQMGSEKEFQPPEKLQVISFFQNILTAKGSTKAKSDLEAQKFFNYFQSVGWKVGKSKPMKDWQAAARNWLLNADTYSSETSKKKKIENVENKKGQHLHTKNDKDYGEPF